MSFINTQRIKYKRSKLLRAAVTLIPYGSLIHTILVPGEVSYYFTPINKAFFKKQAKRKINTILNASIGDWPMIVQNQDLKRDLQDIISPVLMQDFNNSALLIILGDPGAGKTTLLRRLGKELSDSGRAVYELRAGARSAPEWFNYLNQLPRRKGNPFILIDDIFRYEGIEDILLDPDLGCVIIATSRVNEDKTNRLRATNALDFLEIKHADNSKTGWPTLKEPSDGELFELRKKPEFSHLDNKKWQAITTMRRGKNIVSSPMLVVMLQLSADSKPFDQIINDVMTNLQRKHPDTFRAFCILCAFHRFGQLMPTSVFKGLLHQNPGFLRILRSDLLKGKANCGANGLIYLGEFFFYKECWQTAHELIAETASNSEFAGYIESLYDEIMDKIDSTHKEHRVFASRYFRSLTRRSWKELAKEYLTKYAFLIDNLVASDRKQQIVWAIAFDRLDEKDRVLSCLETAIPITPGHANSLISLHVKYDQIDLAIECATNWLSEYPDDTYVRTRYIGLVEQEGTPEQVEKVLSETSSWLKDHPDDTYVRTRYIGLVERRGSSAEIKNILNEINLWIESRCHSTMVLSVFSIFLRLVQKYEHDASISPDCLGNLVKMSYETGSVSTLVSLGNYFRKRGDYEYAKNIFIELIACKKYEDHYGVFYGYGRLLLSLQNYTEAIRLFRISLSIHKGFQMAHDGLALALACAAQEFNQQGRFGIASRYLHEAEMEYKSALYWAKIQKKPLAIFYSHLGWFYIDQERYPEALDAFNDAIIEDSDHFANYWGAAKALIGMGDFQEAKKHLKTALENASEDIDPNASVEIHTLLEQCNRNIQGL